MAQNELLVDVLRRDTGFLKMMLADLTDADLIQRPVPSANNGLWQLGQLVAAEAQMVNACAGRTISELPAGFVDRYKRDTASINDPAKLGTKADLISRLEQVRESTCKWVATLSAADLAKPAPEFLQRMCPTVGHVIHLLPNHVAMHMGQIQVLRRKLGKPILF